MAIRLAGKEHVRCARHGPTASTIALSATSAYGSEWISWSSSSESLLSPLTALSHVEYRLIEEEKKRLEYGLERAAPADI